MQSKNRVWRVRGNTDFIDRIAVPPASPIIIDETIWNTIYSAMTIEPKVFAADWKNQIRWMAERADIL